MAWAEAYDTAFRRKACLYGHQTQAPVSGPALWDLMSIAFSREAIVEAFQTHDPAGKLPKPELQGLDLLLYTLICFKGI